MEMRIEGRAKRGIRNRSSNMTVLMETTFSSVVAVDTEMDQTISVRMKVDVKSLIKAMASIQIEPKAVHFCRIVYRYLFSGFNTIALIIYVVMRGNVGSITYYIPGQLLDE